MFLCCGLPLGLGALKEFFNQRLKRSSLKFVSAATTEIQPWEMNKTHASSQGFFNSQLKHAFGLECISAETIRLLAAALQRISASDTNLRTRLRAIELDRIWFWNSTQTGLAGLSAKIVSNDGLHKRILACSNMNAHTRAHTHKYIYIMCANISKHARWGWKK